MKELPSPDIYCLLYSTGYSRIIEYRPDTFIFLFRKDGASSRLVVLLPTQRAE